MSLTASQITQSYEKNVERVRKAKEELQKAQDKFNEIYTDANREGSKLTKLFSQELFEYIKSRVNFRELYSGVGSSGLTEIFLNDDGMEKISFHNRQWVSNIDGGFTYMIRDENLRSVTGEIDPDMTPEQVGEFILSEYRNNFNPNQ